jgi:small subunit ribosomal protein S6
MIRKYETMFIVQPTLTEEEIKQKIELVKDTLTKQGADIKAVDEMGMRELAYKIEKYERGYYTVIYFTAESSAIKELERIYGITEDIIRFNVINYVKQVEEKAWDNMVKKALGQPVEEKKLSYGPRGDRKPRFDRDRGERKPYQKKEYKPSEEKKEEAKSTEGE